MNLSTGLTELALRQRAARQRRTLANATTERYRRMVEAELAYTLRQLAAL